MPLRKIHVVRGSWTDSLISIFFFPSFLKEQPMLTYTTNWTTINQWQNQDLIQLEATFIQGQNYVILQTLFWRRRGGWPFWSAIAVNNYKARSNGSQEFSGLHYFKADHSRWSCDQRLWLTYWVLKCFFFFSKLSFVYIYLLQHFFFLSHTHLSSKDKFLSIPIP